MVLLYKIARILEISIKYFNTGEIVLRFVRQMVSVTA